MSSIYDLLNTEASNSITGGVNAAEGQDPATVNDGVRQLKQLLAAFVDDLGAVNTVGGTGDAITVTLGQVGGANSISAYATGQMFRFVAGAANTGAVTINVNSIGVKKVRKIRTSDGADIDLSAADIGKGETYFLHYRSTADGGSGAFVLVGAAAVPQASTTASGIVELATPAEDLTGTDTAVVVTAAGLGQFSYALAAAVAGNALTVSLKHRSGSDPSANNPVSFSFRNVTAATGTPETVSVTAATSLTISSGSTMGFASGEIGRLWVVGFNDGGTFRLGLVNCLSGTSVMPLRDGVYSSTAEGGAGGADSAQVIYTGSAVSSKAMVVLGYLEATEATAGTWATAPSLVKVQSVGDPLPGDVLQVQRNSTGVQSSTTTAIPYDTSIPQITEGAQFMSQAITPLSGANLLSIESLVIGAANPVQQWAQALFQDAVSNALAASPQDNARSNGFNQCLLKFYKKALGTTSQTYRTRAGGEGGSTFYFNGAASYSFGGTIASYIEVREIVA